MPSRRKAKKSRLGGRLWKDVGYWVLFIIFICLFIVVFQASGCVVALGVTTYGYVAVINIAVTVPARTDIAFFFTECP